MRTPSVDALVAMTSALFAIAFLTTIGRLGVRLWKRGKLQADDYCNIVALVLLTTFTGLILSYLPDLKRLSKGKPTLDDLKKIITYNILGNTFAKMIYISVQATFLALYWNLFSISKKFRYYWFAVTAYTVLAFLCSFMTSFWGCGKPENIGHVEKCQGNLSRTVNRNSLILVNVANVSSDLAILCLPVAMLRKLNMKLPQKLALMAVFALGLLVIAFDIARTVYSTRKSTMTNIPLVFVWNISEPYVAVTVATLPTFYTLLKRHPKSSYVYEDIEHSSSHALHSDSNKTGASKNWQSQDLHDMTVGRSSTLKRDELELKEIQKFAQM